MGYWQGQTFTDWLWERAQRYGASPALVTAERQWNYRDLWQQSGERAQQFTGLGLRPGDAAVLHLPNHPEFFFNFFGLLLAGVRPVLALPAHRHHEITAFVRQTEAQLYIGPDQPVGRELQAQLGNLPLPVRTLLQPLDLDRSAPHRSELQRTDLAAMPTWPGRQQDPDQPAFYQLSGGSTGTPKLIPRTHDDYLYSVRASAEICALSPQTVYLAALPLAHNFLLSSPGSLGTLHVGGQVVIAPQPDPGTCFGLMERYGINMVALVPALLLVWLEAAARRPVPASLAVVQVGGAPLAPEVAAQVPQQLGATLQQVFGMAEAWSTTPGWTAPCRWTPRASPSVPMTRS
ncbi:AMP-binding protein [Deinococcus radiophilus]|uniref:AMP-binding protein n=1 Tax=Deinococcus radiophilus TaxID=32062 RepID=UPI003623ACD2